MSKIKFRSLAMLLITALIWGLAFVAQSVGMNYIGPFTFICFRTLMGAVTLLPVLFLFHRSKGKQENGRTRIPGERKNLLLGGICCGTALFTASILQQIGIQYTTVGKAGFITTLYIVIVPLLGLFLKRKVSALVWVSVVLALAGMYLLCMTESFSIGKGDLYVIVCSFGYSAHILLIDYFSPKVDGLQLSCLQFLICGMIGVVFMFLFENPSFTAILSALAPLLYAGVLSCGVAYTLQVLAQKNMDPTVASLLLSLESVFAVLAGWILLNQKLSGKELAGCVFVFAAIILAQLPAAKPKAAV